MTQPDVSLDDLDLTGFPPAERALVEEFLRRRDLRKKGETFLDYIVHVAPWFVIEEVHIAIAEQLQRIAEGEIDRLMLFVAPRTGKSQMASVFFPTHYIGRGPDKQIMQVGHSATISEGFGREARNILNLPEFQEVYPECRLSKDSRSVSAWATTKNGKYSTAGVDTGIAGKGWALGILDDLLNEKTALSTAAKKYVHNWYGPGFYSRQMPRDYVTGKGSAIVNIQCMTGDTPVMMGDGTEKHLRDVLPGDIVATHDKGKLLTSMVLGHRMSGVDIIFEIKTVSGRSVRANARHPFLIDTDGEQRWIRVRDLRPGQSMLRVNGANGKVRPVGGKGATRRSCVAGSAPTITWRNEGRNTRALSMTRWLREMLTSSTDMGSLLKNTMRYLSNRVANVLCASNRPEKMFAPTGAANYASITATIPVQYVGYSATTATSQLGTPRPQPQQTPLQSIYDFTLDEIVSICHAGEEEVFDVQIDRTENFIANGLVSHNTRWAVDDLAGWLLAQQQVNPDADKWEVLSIPALLDAKSAELLTRISHDPQYRKYLIGEPITFKEGDSYCPRRFPLKDLMRTKANMSARAWSALYMQSPVAEEGGLLRKEWWKLWPDSKPLPEITYLLQSYDVASETAIHNDNTARTTWGVFKRPSDGMMCAIVMEYSLLKLDFPALLEDALKSYQVHKPDREVIEKASSGIPLYQEFRKRGIPVSPIRPVGTKYSRADAATIPLSQGVIYYPDRQWARNLIDVCAAFPAGPEDDSVDSVTLGINFIRRMFLLETPEDEEPEDDEMDKPPVRSYARRQSRMRIAA